MRKKCLAEVPVIGDFYEKREKLSGFTHLCQYLTQMVIGGTMNIADGVGRRKNLTFWGVPDLFPVERSFADVLIKMASGVTLLCSTFYSTMLKGVLYENCQDK